MGGRLGGGVRIAVKLYYKLSWRAEGGGRLLEEEEEGEGAEIWIGRGGGSIKKNFLWFLLPVS